MKAKMYLRTLLAMLFLATASAGCSDKDDPEPIDPTQYGFRVEVGNVTDQGAVVKVIPDQQSGAATWYCSIVKEEYFKKFSDDDAYLQDDLASLDKSQLQSLLKSGEQEVSFGNLTAATNYVAYAYGISADGEATSSLAKATFTTQSKTGPDPGDGLTFEISITNISMTAADIYFTPSDNEATYYFDVSPSEVFAGMTDEEIRTEIINNYVDAAYLTQGPDGYSAEMIAAYAPLTPGKEYCAYAIGYDAQKGATSELALKRFTTLEPTGEAPELTLEVRAGDADGNNTSSSIYCHAYSPQAVSGRILAAEKATVDQLLAQGATLDDLISYNGSALTAEEMAMLVVEPGLGFTFEVPASTELTVIMKVVSEGGMATIKSADVTTTAVQPSDLTFSFSVTEITTSSANIEVTPSNNEETYFFDIQEKAVIDSFEGDMNEIVAAFNQAYAQYGGIVGMLSQGPESYPITGLSSNTTYYVLAFGYSGGPTTELATYEFTTEAPVMSDLTFEITIDENAEPIPGGVNATITPSDPAAYYLFAFTLADDIDMMTSDAEIVAFYEEMYGPYISYLLVAGQYQTLPTDFGGELALMPGAEYYLVVFGYDGGANTPVTKVRFTAGAGPDPTGTEFTFSVSDLTATTATIDVTASQEPVIYMWDIFTEQEYNDYGGTPQVFTTYIQELFDYYSAAYTPAQIIAGLGAWYSGANYAYQELEAGTTYIPFAVCVDAKGNIIGEAAVGESFTTLAAGTAGVRADRTSAPERFFRQMQPQSLTPAAIEQLMQSRARLTAEPQSSVRDVRGAELVIPTGRTLHAMPILRSEISSMPVTQARVQTPENRSIRTVIGNLHQSSQMRTERAI